MSNIVKFVTKNVKVTRNNILLLFYINKILQSLMALNNIDLIIFAQIQFPL